MDQHIRRIATGVACIFLGTAACSEDAQPNAPADAAASETGGGGTNSSGGGGASGSRNSGGTQSTGGAARAGGAGGAPPSTGGTSAGGSTGDASATGGASGSTGGASGATGGTSNTGGSSVDASLTDGATGDASTSPVDVTLTTQPHLVPAGADAWVCQEFRNPFGFDAAIIRSESTMPSGGIEFVAEHGNFGPFMPDWQSCAQGEPGLQSVHEGTALHDTIVYPPGAGRVLLAAERIRLAIHYWNASSSVPNATATLKLRAVRENQIQHRAELMFLDVVTTRAPPGSSSVTRNFPLPFGIEMIRAFGVIYSRGTHFHAASGALVLSDFSNWLNPPATALVPPVSLAQGSTITFTCDYTNPTAAQLPINRQSYPGTGERCTFEAVFYSTSPANNGLPINALAL